MRVAQNADYLRQLHRSTGAPIATTPMLAVSLLMDALLGAEEALLKAKLYAIEAE